MRSEHSLVTAGRDPVGRQVIPNETKLKHQAVTLEAPTHKPEKGRGGLEDQGCVFKMGSPGSEGS